MTGSPLAMPIRVMHRWRQRMSGIELSILFAGAALCLFLVKKAVWVPDVLPLPGRPAVSIWQELLFTLLHAFLALDTVVIVSLALAGLSRQFPRFRQLLVPALSVARSIPGLGLTGLLALVLPPLATIVIVAAFNMIWRVLTAILDAEETLPPELNEVAIGLHMTGWQHFWRLQMPVAIPLVAFRASQALPGLWFRLLCVEGLATLLMRHDVGGLGAQALIGLETHHASWFLTAGILAVLLILIIDQCLTRPMMGWAQRYRLDGPQPQKNRGRSWMLQFWRESAILNGASVGLHRLIGGIGNWRVGRARRHVPAMSYASFSLPDWLVPLASLVLLGLAVAHSHLTDRLPYDLLESILTLSHVCGALVLCGLLWLPLALFFFDAGERMFRVARLLVLAGALFPAVLFYPLFREFDIIPAAVLLFIGAHWLTGGTVLDAMQAIPGPFRQVARGLRLKGALLWKRLILPAVAPDLCGGLLLAAVPIWDAVMIAEAFVPSDTGLGATLLADMLQGQIAAQVVVLMLLTLLSMLLDRLVLQPLAVHAAQKYAIQ
ncbi:ABC transporter permease subunit [Gluconobacter frateurii]|uniref:Transporter n=1 Tax=Gluconobacter frateurii NRIC 0228 TaxID=1307946 RepID=A0ABQ0QE18_9PROT|nr:ABC transporter permease subunit [Gluconobacter frateurii]GBR15124.1 transporter [Gluconobacter frateurii NRIC 0228]GLP90226.1 ABC transporter permease [Gluconobacter frateurii]